VDHAISQYLDAVKCHGSAEMVGKGSGIHVEKLEIAGLACAETAAKQRQLITEVAEQFAVDVVAGRSGPLLENRRKTSSEQGVCIILHQWPSIALEHGVVCLHQLRELSFEM